MKSRFRFSFIASGATLAALVLAGGTLHAADNAAASYEIGVQALEAKNYETAFQHLLTAAEQGHAEAQFALSGCYYAGHGTAKDSEAALKWLRKAANQGLADAQYQLGIFYDVGACEDCSQTMAVKWLKKAAEQGHEEAKLHLCIFDPITEEELEEGEELPPTPAPPEGEDEYCTALSYIDDDNYAEAVKYFTIAAEKGHANAQYCLGNCYFKGHGVKKNKLSAMEWFSKASSQDHALAREMMSKMDEYEAPSEEADYNKAIQYMGAGNYGEAIKHLQRAAENGHADSQFMLGSLYYSGQGVEKNLDEAAKWLRMAAAQGNQGAQAMLAYLPAAPIDKPAASTPQNMATAKELMLEGKYADAAEILKHLAEKGDTEAQYHLAVCYYYGKGVEMNIPEAIEWYRKAADRGHANAQCNLGICYEFGLGVNKDLSKAAYWYRKAAEQGNDIAKKALNKLQSDTRGNN